MSARAGKASKIVARVKCRFMAEMPQEMAPNLHSVLIGKPSVAARTLIQAWNGEIPAGKGEA
jgi:hypothetical protein